jgi:hypothetical protein
MSEIGRDQVVRRAHIIDTWKRGSGAHESRWYQPTMSAHLGEELRPNLGAASQSLLAKRVVEGMEHCIEAAASMCNYSDVPLSQQALAEFLLR